MGSKTHNAMGWLFVLPVVVLVAFNAIIPLMAVVNYSVQETFGNNMFFFEGVKWFEQVLHSDRFHASLGRQLMFSGIVLAIEVPLGVAIALAMPRRGPWVSVCLVLMALPLAQPSASARSSDPTAVPRSSPAVSGPPSEGPPPVGRRRGP